MCFLQHSSDLVSFHVKREFGFMLTCLDILGQLSEEGGSTIFILSVVMFAECVWYS